MIRSITKEQNVYMDLFSGYVLCRLLTNEGIISVVVFKYISCYLVISDLLCLLQCDFVMKQIMSTSFLWR